MVNRTKTDELVCVIFLPIITFQLPLNQGRYCVNADMKYNTAKWSVRNN